MLGAEYASIPYSIRRLYRLFFNVQPFTCRKHFLVFLRLYCSFYSYFVYIRMPPSLSFCLQWFSENVALDTNDSLEKQKIFKFRGDLAIRQGDFQVNNSVFYSLTPTAVKPVSLLK